MNHFHYKYTKCRAGFIALTTVLMTSCITLSVLVGVIAVMQQQGILRTYYDDKKTSVRGTEDCIQYVTLRLVHNSSYDPSRDGSAYDQVYGHCVVVSVTKDSSPSYRVDARNIYNQFYTHVIATITQNENGMYINSIQEIP